MECQKSTPGYLGNFEITDVAPCMVEVSRFRVSVLLDNDIDELMPYLNAVFKFNIYNPNPAEPTFSFKYKGYPVTLYTRKVVIGQLTELDEANQILYALVRLINQVYDKRQEITPAYEKKDLPQGYQVYALLPRTNCGQCGEYTCLAFALKLLEGKQALGNCLDLTKENFATIDQLVQTIDDSTLLDNGLN